MAGQGCTKVLKQASVNKIGLNTAHRRVRAHTNTHTQKQAVAIEIALAQSYKSGYRHSHLPEMTAGIIEWQCPWSMADCPFSSVFTYFLNRKASQDFDNRRRSKCEPLKKMKRPHAA